MTDPGDPARWLKLFLAEHDAPCPSCKYNLRGLTGDRCPECGEELHLGVGLAEPKLASFLASAISLGAGMGFNGLILAWAVWRAMFDGFPGVFDLYTLFASLIVEGAAMLALLRGRRWFRARKAGTRLTIACAAGAATVASAMWFFAVVE